MDHKVLSTGVLRVSWQFHLLVCNMEQRFLETINEIIHIKKLKVLF